MSEESFFPQTPRSSTPSASARPTARRACSPGRTTRCATTRPATTQRAQRRHRRAVTYASHRQHDLKPERTSEFETGFEACDASAAASNLDVHVLRQEHEGRAHLGHRAAVGAAREPRSAEPRRRAAIAASSCWSTPGAVDRTRFGWDLTLQASINTNEVRSLGNTPPQIGTATASQEGYPIDGFWARPITGWEDKNKRRHPDVLTPTPRMNEVFVGDSARVFRGYNQPRYTAHADQRAVELLQRKLRVQTLARLPRRQQVATTTPSAFAARAARTAAASQLRRRAVQEQADGRGAPRSPVATRSMATSRTARSCGCVKCRCSTRSRPAARRPPRCAASRRRSPLHGRNLGALDELPRHRSGNRLQLTSGTTIPAEFQTLAPAELLRPPFQPRLLTTMNLIHTVSSRRRPRGRSPRGARGRAAWRSAPAPASRTPCSSATIPDIITPEQREHRRRARSALAQRRARCASATSPAGNESTWLFGGLLGDEWSHELHVRAERRDGPAPRSRTNNGQVTGMLLPPVPRAHGVEPGDHRAQEVHAHQPAAIGEMYFARGFAEMQLASDFCNGIPLSTQPRGRHHVRRAEAGGGSVHARCRVVRQRAGHANGTDAVSRARERAARVGKARALLGLGQYAAASARRWPAFPRRSRTITRSRSRRATTSSGARPAAQRATRSATSLEGNARNMLVKNAIPFFSAERPAAAGRRSVTSNGAGRRRRACARTTLYGQLDADRRRERHRCADDRGRGCARGERRA